MKVYLDYAATAPISDSTKKYLVSILDLYGNPSSLHSIGDKAHDLITRARQSVSKFISSDSSNIYFTPGGSASNTMSIKGYCEANDCSVFYSPIAHKSILKIVDDLSSSHSLRVNDLGRIDLQDLCKQLAHSRCPSLVVVDYANSEIGTIQEVEQIIEIAHRYNGIVYLDCTGSIPTIPLNVKQLDVDMCGFSAHKLGGLKGCGVLYKKRDINLSPLIYGNQESGLVGGTENVFGIASLYKVIDDYDYSSITSTNRDYVFSFVSENIPNSYLIGSKINRLPHNLYLCFRDVDGESLMLYLDLHGIQVSTGSACNSSNIDPSHTLTAIHMCKRDINSCIRMTFSGRETKEELDYVCMTLDKAVKSLRQYRGVKQIFLI